MDPSLTEAYDSAVRRVAAEASLPVLPGTVDTYSYDQADLLARGLQWSPRKVFQSYAAFSPVLAQANREHLSGTTAPEWIVFAPQPIDHHYPSAEDGPSWVELLHRYEPVMGMADKVVLRRRSVQSGAGPLTGDEVTDARLEERVALDVRAGLHFVKFDIDPTALGRAAMALYKSEPLRLTTWTADGAEHSYRLPLGMAQAGFLLSPVTTTASEFGSLYGDASGYETPDRTVVAIRVDSSDLLWNRTYRVTVSSVPTPPPSG
jgi:hypothetical protein